MVNVTDALVNQMLGPMFRYCFLPMIGQSGGILMAWRSDIWSMMDISFQQFLLIVKASRVNVALASWWVTVVYGPQEDAAKCEFLNSLATVRAASPVAWLLCGDFNMIYKETDKSSGRLDRRSMRRFRSFINRVAIEDLQLVGRRFTWSNRRDAPTLELERLDRVFASPDWMVDCQNHTLIRLLGPLPPLAANKHSKLGQGAVQI
jgi:hypothetical protein